VFGEDGPRRKPALGQVRVSNELAKRGLLISPAGVRCVWMRHDLQTLQRRLKALKAMARRLKTSQLDTEPCVEDINYRTTGALPRRSHWHSTWSALEVRRVIAPKALDRFKQRIREITQRAKGVSMETTMEELAPYMRGRRGYFGFCETPEVLIYLTRWVRLRLRAALWRQWKTPRRRRAALLALGVRLRLASNTAGSGRGPWVSRPGQGSLWGAFEEMAA
jgi:hypothetical protein